MRVFLVLLFWSIAGLSEELSVTIRYGGSIPDKTLRTTYTPETTALEALKQVSTVQTSKTGKYLFVRAIDGVTSQIGTFGWFYTIDGKPVHTTAENYRLEDAKSMTWTYKVEACY